MYYAVLSGLHPTLPLAELKGILEALGQEYRFIEVFDQLVVYTSSSKTSRGVASRAGLVQETGRVIAVSEAELGTLIDSLLASDLCRYIGLGDCVRVELLRLRGYAKETMPSNAARIIAERLEPHIESCGAVATPRNPTKRLRVIITQGVAVAGLLEDEKPDKLLESHRPQKRPFFHPGSLDPRLARLFVNLSRARPPGPYLDPFCGTGGFPLEAQTIGIPSICGELARRLAEGASKNLRAYPGHENILTVAQWDSTRIPLRDESVQSIGTDPPYGKSVSLRGKQLGELLEHFTAEAARVLKKDSYLAFAAPHWAEDKAEEYLEENNLKLLELHYMRVHGSLTRIIVVAIKKI